MIGREGKYLLSESNNPEEGLQLRSLIKNNYGYDIVLFALRGDWRVYAGLGRTLMNTKQ